MDACSVSEPPTIHVTAARFEELLSIMEVTDVIVGGADGMKRSTDGRLNDLIVQTSAPPTDRKIFISSPN
jgi:hypothetical protein